MFLSFARGDNKSKVGNYLREGNWRKDKLKFFVFIISVDFGIELVYGRFIYSWSTMKGAEQ